MVQHEAVQVKRYAEHLNDAHEGAAHSDVGRKELSRNVGHEADDVSADEDVDDEVKLLGLLDAHMFVLSWLGWKQRLSHLHVRPLYHATEDEQSKVDDGDAESVDQRSARVLLLLPDPDDAFIIFGHRLLFRSVWLLGLLLFDLLGIPIILVLFFHQARSVDLVGANGVRLACLVRIRLVALDLVVQGAPILPLRFNFSLRRRLLQ